MLCRYVCLHVFTCLGERGDAARAHLVRFSLPTYGCVQVEQHQLQGSGVWLPEGLADNFNAVFGCLT